MGAHAHGALFAAAREHQRGAPGGHAVGAAGAALLCGQRSRRQGPGQRIGLGALQQGLARLLPLVDQRGVHARFAEGRVVEQVAQKACVVAQAQQRGVVQRGHEAADGVLAVAAMGDELGHHGVVVGGDFAALADAGVDAHLAKRSLAPGAARQRLLGPPVAHRAGLRREAVVGVFGVQAHLDGMAGQHDVLLRQRQRFARRHAQLPLHQVLAGDAFGHRVLDLQARVHFQEVVVVLRIDDELDRARAPVAHGQRGSHGVCAHLRAHLRRDHGGGRFLDHLLAAALRRAVALAQVHGVAVRIGEHLDLDVAAVVDQALQHQRAVAKGAGGFAPGALDGGLQLVVVPYQAHAAPAAARHGFDQ